MDRPRIVTHMHISLDGKINGKHLETADSERSQEIYYDLMLGENAFYKNHRGWLCGTDTSMVICGNREVDLNRFSDEAPEGDYISEEDLDMHYFTLDNHGKLDWEKNTFKYFDTVASVVMLIPSSVSGKYKNFLRDKKISYLISGEDRVDLKLAVEKIAKYFPMEELMVNGGGGINYSFLEEGLMDELSLIVTPIADTDPDSKSLFYANKKYNAPRPFPFKLKDLKAMEDGSVWARYDVLK